MLQSELPEKKLKFEHRTAARRLVPSREAAPKPTYTMLRPRLRIPRAPRFGLQRTTSSPSPFLRIARPQNASVHTLPPSVTYPFKDTSPDSQPLLTPVGFDIAWTQYQTMLIHKLNQMTVGTSLALIVCPLQRTYPPQAANGNTET